MTTRRPTTDDDDDSATDDDDIADDDDLGDDDDSASSGPSVVTLGTCTGTVYTWTDNPVSQPELNIIGMYESTGGHGNPAGTTTVDVQRDGPMVLVLSSYEPVVWDLTVGPSTTITEIVLNGYNVSTVVGAPVGTVITDLTTPGSYWVACGYAWPSSSGGCDTPGLVSAAQAYTGLTLSSWSGCYHGTAWTLN